MLNPVMTYTGGGIQPVYDGALLDNVALQYGNSLPAGQALGLVTGSGAAVDDVQTVTINYTPTGGTVSLQYGTINIPGIAYNSTAAQAQAKINAALGAGNTTTDRYAVVTGGPFPGTPLVVTFSGLESAGNSHVLMTAQSSLTGGTPGTVAVAHTTNGMPAGGYFAAYSDGASDGSQTMRRILKYDTTVGPAGAVTWGNVDGSGFAGAGAAGRSIPAYFHGVFKCADVVGLDANGVADVGRLLNANVYTAAYALLAMNGGG